MYHFRVLWIRNWKLCYALQENHLHPNVAKTKERVVGMNRPTTPATPISIHGVCVETMGDFKYLGVYTD